MIFGVKGTKKFNGLWLNLQIRYLQINLKDILDTLAPKGSPYKISALYIKKQPSYDGIYKKQDVSANRVSANNLGEI